MMKRYLFKFETASSYPAMPEAFGTIYLMAICPNYRVLTHVLERRSEPSDEEIGWWRCYLCLEWHLYLVPK